MPTTDGKMTPEEQIKAGYKYNIYTGQLLQSGQTPQPQNQGSSSQSFTPPTVDTSSLREQVQKGMLSGDAAKQTLQAILVNAYGGHVVAGNPQFTNPDAQKAYYNAIGQETTKLFSGLGTIKMSSGEYGTFDTSGNFIKQSTTENKTTVGPTGTTTTSTEKLSTDQQKQLGYKFDIYTGQPLSQSSDGKMTEDQQRAAGYKYNIYTGQPIPAAPTKSDGSSSSSSSTSNASVSDTLKRFFSTDDISKIPPDQQAMFAAVADYLTNQYEQGKTISSLDLNSFQKIYESAKNDPTIAAKYGDAFKLADAAFNETVANLQADAHLTQDQQKDQFSEQRKQLTEQEAEAGRAYSGFRNKAEETLKKNQSGIVESTRRDLQAKINTAGRAYEERFGSSSLLGKSNTGIAYVDPLTEKTSISGYSPIGGVKGTDPANKEADSIALAEKNFTYST